MNFTSPLVNIDNTVLFLFQTAIKLYKIVAEERFLLWVICSIQLQVVIFAMRSLSFKSFAGSLVPCYLH